jgi:nicotinate phosphoribosyltransferase
MGKTDIKNYISKHTDKYFTHTKNIVEKNADKTVVYCVFVRKPSVYACKQAIDWLNSVAKSLGFNINILEQFKEGDLVPAGDPLFFMEGSFAQISELETLLLQKVGMACLTAWHGYMLSKTMPNVSFISMIARHCAGAEMVSIAEYGVSVGSKKAQNEGYKGFIGCSTDANAQYFGMEHGLGTMPHSLIGYAGSTLNAAKLYFEHINTKQMTILVDYFGKEITDALEVCEYFKDLAISGGLSIRLDTHGGRFLEGLDYDKSHQVIEKYVPNAFKDYKDKDQVAYLTGTGVSAAAVYYTREKLNEAGFNNVKIVASSGFNLKKCCLMAEVKAPIDVVGTGSFLPDHFTDTYATADVLSYNGIFSIKKGREYLIQRWKNRG